MTDRLKNLESLLSSLAKDGISEGPHVAGEISATMGDRAMTNAGPDSSSGAEPSSITSPKVASDGLLGGNMANYLDSSHWSSLLEDIKEIREQLSPSSATEQPLTMDSSSTNAEWTPQEAQDGIDIIFGQHEVLDPRQLLESLPSREVCDSLVSQYFRPRHAILRGSHYLLFHVCHIILADICH